MRSNVGLLVGVWMDAGDSHSFSDTLGDSRVVETNRLQCNKRFYVMKHLIVNNMDVPENNCSLTIAMTCIPNSSTRAKPFAKAITHRWHLPLPEGHSFDPKTKSAMFAGTPDIHLSALRDSEGVIRASGHSHDSILGKS